ncbi:MAG TPA: ABC transporter permease [Archaeoglobus veneficus]|nr:ABC transporter permease [Archaeoglobus veneficus]
MIEFIVSLLQASIRAGTPLLYATLGEMITEKSGILNLGVEGLMIMGAMSGFALSFITGNPWIGILAGGFAGLILAFIHGFFSITLKVDQTVSGLMLVLLGLGLSGLIGKSYIGMVANYIDPIAIPLLSSLPILGKILFTQDLVVYSSLLITVFIWFILHKTSFGLSIIAAGENPEAADTAGINVDLVRYICLLVGGFLIGVGGAYLSLAYAKLWTEGMTAGRGWICLALVIFSGWIPQRAVIGAYLFGGLDVLSFKLQAIGFTIPYQLLKMIPYIATILVLLLSLIKDKYRLKAPSALGKPYFRGER